MQYKRSRLLCVPSLPHSLLFHNFQTYCRRINHRSTRRILNPNISTVNSEGGKKLSGVQLAVRLASFRATFLLVSTRLHFVIAFKFDRGRALAILSPRARFMNGLAASRCTTGEISGEQMRSTRSYRRGNVPRLGQHLLLTFSRWRKSCWLDTLAILFRYRPEFFRI